MQQVWEEFKTFKGCLLEDIYADTIHSHQVKKDLFLTTSEPLLCIRKNNTSGIKYWKLAWTEEKGGEDILLLKAQKTPDPLAYELIDTPYQKHIIQGSSFSVQQNTIKKVMGYGFKLGNSEILSAVVLELQDVYIFIKSAPAMEIEITEEEPDGLGNTIFST